MCRFASISTKLRKLNKLSNFALEKDNTSILKRHFSKYLNLTLIIVPVLLALIAPSVSAQRNVQNNQGKDDGKKTYPPGSAWTLSYPLGTHVESTLDTLLYNFQREFISAIRSDAWATTGQFTGPSVNMMYFQRQNPSYFHFEDALDYWTPSFRKQKFYNVYIPFTQLYYGWGVGTQNRTDHLMATFAGNVNRKIGVGAWIDYPYTLGSYASQATKGLGFGFSGYYDGPRYEVQAFFNRYTHTNKENGGITDDLYITDPAQLQGGVNSIEPQSIPVRLTNAHNFLRGLEFYMNHAYKIGFWKDITEPEDTVEKREYVPVTKFVYSFDYKSNDHLFINTNAKEGHDFWTNSYFNDSRTEDNSTYWSVSNTLGIELIEGFQKWAKFGLSAYVTYELDKYRYAVDRQSADRPDTELTPLPENFDGKLSSKRNRLWVGGRIEKTKGSIIRYSADAKFGLIGDAIGEIDVRGDLLTKFRLGKDTVMISAGASFQNLEPNYFLQKYVGNHFIWDNNFGKIRSLRAQGKLYIPWTRTELSVGFDNLQNAVYFNSASLPAQFSGNIQVFSAAICQKLRFGIWNWDNTVTYQATSDKEIMPLPQLVVYSNMYLYFKAFKALTVQVGIDCDWYTKYKGYAYQPATMSFVQQGANAVDVGNFIMSNVYLTARIYKVRLFLMCSHLNQGWFSKNYFSLPHYPIDPRQFRLGLSINFSN